MRLLVYIILRIFGIYQKAVFSTLTPLWRKGGRKIFIGCHDIANNLKFMKGLFGDECITVSKRQSVFYDYNPDIRFPFFLRNSRFFELIKMICAPFIFLYCISKCHIFIYFWNEALLLDRSFEFKTLKKYNKILIVRYLGCDIRHWEPAFEELEEKGILHVCCFCGHAFSETCNKIEKQKTAEESDKYADIIYSNVDMPSFLKGNYKTTRIPLDLADYEYSFIENSVPRVVHAPSNPVLKGTPIIRLALSQLKRKGYEFKYTEIRGRENKEVLSELTQSQIAIDQLGGCGTSLFALEAMACGNIVLGGANKKFNPTILEDCPIIQINPLNIYNKLKWVLDHPEMWNELAIKGREYVRSYHDKEKVASQLRHDIFQKTTK